MGDAAEHIAAWESAGLIDGLTADRLRAAEQAASGPPDEVEPEITPGERPRLRTSSLFGPSVSIAEAFGYLGATFLLGAWYAWIANQTSHAVDPSWVIGIGAGVAAAGLAILGLVLHLGRQRQRRAAGVAFLFALANLATAAYTLLNGADLGALDVPVTASAVVLAVAVAMRGLQPAVLTQIGLLSSLTSFVWTALAWFEQGIFPNRLGFDSGLPGSTGPDPIVLVIGSAAWWLSAAVAIGLLGLAESAGAERSGDAAGGRRAGVTRFWAGMVAILGLASAVTRSDFLGNGSYGRVLEPWVGEVAVLVVVAVLIERAFRRESSAYVYAAAVGLVVALSDLNVNYLTGGIESALLVEGLILLGAGVAADRLRRRIGRLDEPPTGPSGMAGEVADPEVRGDDLSPGATSVAPTEP